MKKILTIFGAVLFVVMLNIGCGSGNKAADNADSLAIDSAQKVADQINDEGTKSEIDEESTDETTETTEAPSNDGSITVTAKFVSAGAFEGQATLTFKKEDGTKISFCRNYMNPKEPELKFNFIGDDAASANTDLVGQTFIIKYKINKTGQDNVQTGDPEPCNQIMSVEKK